VATRDDMRRAAEAILALGARAVLVKGGHLAGDSAADLLADGENETWLEQERIDTVHTHGTGCTLSAAIAAYRAKGLDLAQAVAGGKLFVTGAIRGGLAIGQGIGPVDQLWELRKD
jgi:hydroxymethylpyrimidine/phosphomethylpyrimidine kinase